MAFGGILGIMNTMFAAISQRSKDIGILRLLGFSRWQVLRSFLLESVVIAVLGGLLGSGLGLLADLANFSHSRSSEAAVVDPTPQRIAWPGLRLSSISNRSRAVTTTANW